MTIFRNYWHKRNWRTQDGESCQQCWCKTSEEPGWCGAGYDHYFHHIGKNYIDHSYMHLFNISQNCFSQLKINTVSICPAAGQVVEKTPCPAVKFFVNFQLIISKPCLYGWNIHYFHRSVNFGELGTRYTGIFNFEALGELPDTKS